MNPSHTEDRSGTHRVEVLIAACVIFTLIFVLRLAFAVPQDAALVLLVVPLALVACELGAVAGLIAGAGALGVFAIVVAVGHSDVPPLAYVSRGIAFAVAGAGFGYLADRERRMRRQLVASEEELRRTVAQLERSNRDLEQLATVASHDLRQPLVAICGFSELLADQHGDALGESGGKLLDHVRRAAGQMRELLEDILTSARADEKPSQRTEIACEPLARMVAEEVLAEQRDAEVEIDPLPVVQANEAQLGRVLTNLIANAVKFRNGLPPRVRVSASREEGAWRIAVQDNGIGVSPQDADRIFHMFERAHSKEYPGAGIGLAACRRIVESHGGKLWVEPAPSGGSVFSFTIPDEPPGADRRELVRL
jgi:signal transduction histidine kinase